MTSPDLAPTASAAPAADRVLLGAVTAVLVTRGSTGFLEDSLSALLATSPRPDRVIVVDVAADDPAQLPAGLAEQVTVVHAPGTRTFGGAVDRALREAVPAVTTGWLWLFHDDCAPAPDALGHLLRALEHTSQVAVAGTKQVRWEKPDELVEVGFTVSRSGRRMTGVEDGELDQGQHDSREDVLAVGLTGALVRRSVWDELGGTVATYGPFGDSLDFCYRARRAGHRVLVVPSAVVRHAQARLTGSRDSDGAPLGVAAPADADPARRAGSEDDLLSTDRSFGARLRSQLFFLAVTVPVWVLPFFLVAAVVAGPVRALGRIALKQPAQAVDELLSPLWLLARLGRIVRTRFDAARTTTVPRRLLRPLMATTRDVLGSHQDRRLAHRARRKVLHGPHELDRPEIARAARRRWGTLALLVVAVSTLTVIALGSLVGTVTGSGRVVGGALPVADGGWSELWQAVSGGWIRDGLGASAPVDPLLTVLAPVMVVTGGDLQTAVNAVVVLALVLSALGAWFAAGAATRSLSLRIWAVLVWVAAPALLVAVGQGRLGAVLVHATLPWFALALARGLGVQRFDVWGQLRRRSALRADQRLQEREHQRALAKVAAGRTMSSDGADLPLGRVRADLAPVQRVPHGSLAALGAAALLGAVVVAGAPVLLVPLLVVVAVVAAAAPRHRRLLLLVPVPALVLVGPLLVRAVATWGSGGWRILLGDPGLPTASEPARSWQQLVGLPVEPTRWFLGTGAWGQVGWYGTYALGALLVLCALVGLLRRGGRGRTARAGWAVAVVGLLTALLSSATVVAAGAGGVVTGWSGAGLSLMTAGLLAAALVGLDGLSTKAQAHTFGWRQVVVAVVAVVVAAVPVAGLTVWAAQTRGPDSTLDIRALDRAIVPAVGQQMQTSGRQARVLVIEEGSGGEIAYQLLHGDGPQLTDSSVVVAVGSLAEHTDPIAGLVAAVASGVDGDQATTLGDYGVGAVLVPPSQDASRGQLVSRIDMVAGIQRITENESGTIWRVVPGESLEPVDQPAWARVLSVDTSGTRVVDEVLDADGLSIDTQVPAGDPGRVVVLAENAAPGWRATLDGEPLRSVEADRPTFELGADGGQLVVGYERASRTPWLLLQGAVLLVFVLLAVPVRRRRGADR